VDLLAGRTTDHPARNVHQIQQLLGGVWTGGAHPEMIPAESWFAASLV